MSPGPPPCQPGRRGGRALTEPSPSARCSVHPSQTPEELDMEPVVTLVVEHALPGGGEPPRSLPQAVGA